MTIIQVQSGCCIVCIISNNNQLHNVSRLERCLQVRLVKLVLNIPKNFTTNVDYGDLDSIARSGLVPRDFRYKN